MYTEVREGGRHVHTEVREGDNGSTVAYLQRIQMMIMMATTTTSKTTSTTTTTMAMIHIISHDSAAAGDGVAHGVCTGYQTDNFATQVCTMFSHL